MLKTMRAADMIAGGLLAALGLVTFLASLRIAEGAGGQLHPRNFPILLSALILCGGLVLLVRAVRAGPGGKAVDWPDGTGWKNWWIGLGLMVLYVLAMTRLGFLIATFLFIVVMMVYYGRYKWYVSSAYGLGAILFIYFVFMRLLQLPFPMGPLSFLR